MRILIAAILGAAVLFLWGFLTHAILPIGEMGMSKPQNEDAVLQSVQANLPAPGIYVLPYFSHEQMNDEAVANAWAEKAKANPYAFVVVAPPPTDPMSMGRQMATQFGSMFIASLIVAWLLAATSWGFGSRVVGATAMGIFVWVASVVPIWNWYRFPTDYMIGGLIEHAVGWLLGGIVIAWWVGRK
jgi:hypothetical protein